MMGFRSFRRRLAAFVLMQVVVATSFAAPTPINSPYRAGQQSENTLYSAFFGSTPKTVDPALSFSSNETAIVYNAYEPLYRYHYLKRPYELEGLGAERVVIPTYLNKAGQTLPADAPAADVAQSIYDITIRRGMRYAPHPALARKPDGTPAYVPVDFSALPHIERPGDFPESGTREVTAEDYLYGIKRLASPRVPSPAFSSLARRIVGLDTYAQTLAQASKALREQGAGQSSWMDLRQYPLEGVTALDSHTLRIRVNGKDPQFKYWLAMTFFSPVPWEADQFYSQPGMAQHNLSLARWPVGAGPFYLSDFQLNRGFTLERNPNYWGMPYPCEGSDADRAAGRLDDCGKATQLLDRAEFVLEKESIPLTGKFLQGYYDSPGLDRGEYGVAMIVAAGDSPTKAALYKERALNFTRVVEQTAWYMGFNWQDPVVGGDGTPEQQEKNRKLRMAISMAVDWQEYIAIFQDGEGRIAHSPIPPGIFGHREGADGINREIYDVIDGRPRLKSLEQAQRLMREAGYPDGRSARTGAPLVLNFDAMTGGGNSPTYLWLRRAFARLGIQLELRSTDFNRFQEKLNNGSGQVYLYGWVADYPDAENFLTLLYGPNSKVKTGGENAFNYSNPEYDALYTQMVTLEDGPEKQALIDKMVDIVRHDAPMMFGYNPAGAGVYQQWVGNAAPSQMVRNALQFYKVDPVLRVEKQAEWNRPIWWPLLGVIALLALVFWVSARSLKHIRQRNALGRVASPMASHTAKQNSTRGNAA